MIGPHDPRWTRLTDAEWRCAGCGGIHTGLLDLGIGHPHNWFAAEPANSLLNEDFCVIDEQDFFVRCVLRIPLVGAEGSFGYGVWSSLSKANFELYWNNFNDDDYGAGIVWFGWLSSHLKGYPDTTLELKCAVHPQTGGQRPLIELMDGEHPLIVEQREGMTYDRLMEVYALNGHAPEASKKRGLLDFFRGKGR